MGVRMSEHMLEIRNVRHLDGTVETMYRIGTRDWVPIKYYSESVLVEMSDGTFRREARS